MNRYRPILALGVICVSAAAIFIRLTDAPPIIIAAYRLCLATIFITPVVLTRSGKELTRLNPFQIMLAMFSGIFLALHFALWIASLKYTSVASSVVLVTSSPIFVALVSFWLFKEKLTLLSIAGIAVCILGAVIIGYVNWQTGSIQLLGAILALLGAIVVSGYMIIGRILRQKMGLISYIFITYGTAGIAMLLSALASRLPLVGYSNNIYLMFLLLALVPQVLGHSALNWSLRFASATEITIAVLGEPVIATILAYFILRENPQILEIAGGIIILGGIYLALYRSPVRITPKR